VRIARHSHGKQVNFTLSCYPIRAVPSSQGGLCRDSNMLSVASDLGRKIPDQWAPVIACAMP